MHVQRSTSMLVLASVVVVAVLAIASVLGLALGAHGLYGDPATALGPTPSTSGILVPGLLGHDAFNLMAGVPLLLVVIWFAGRGNRAALLLWPGVLFYVL